MVHISGNNGWYRVTDVKADPFFHRAFEACCAASTELREL